MKLNKPEPKIALFVYGKLLPGSKYEPKTASSADPDSITATMYALNNEIAGDSHDVGVKLTDTGIARGYVITVDESEVKAIDREESPQFKRKPITTKSGRKAHVYEYMGPVPKGAKVLEKYTPPKSIERSNQGKSNV